MYCCVDGAPDPPTDLVARLVDSRTVSLQWKESRDNGSPIVAYSVHYECARSGELQKVIRNTSITLSHLMPFTNYTFFIKAYNSVGISRPSLSVSLVTGNDGMLTTLSYLLCLLYGHISNIVG